MNLPNKLSLLRIFLVPIFVAAFYLSWEYSRLVSAGIFVIATLTDFLDGYIARKRNLVTDLGKLLDPIADKLLVTSALFCIVSAASTPTYSIVLAVCSAIIVGRELLVSAIRQIAASKGQVIAANVFGKVKTILQDVALPLVVVLQCPAFVATKAAGWLYDVTFYCSAALFVLATIMTIISGAIYLAQNKKVFGGAN